MLHEARWCDDMHLACPSILFVDDTLDPAEMVGVAVAVDYGHDRLVRTMLQVQRQACSCRLGAGQRIDDDQAMVAFDDRHVGKVESAYLIDSIADLEQAVMKIEACLAPETRIRGLRRFLRLQKAVVGQAPHEAAELVANVRIRQRCDKAALRLFFVDSVFDG
jgi:hypothetical protein